MLTPTKEVDVKTQKAVTTAVVVGFLVALASGCGAMQRTYTRWTGDLTYKCSKSGVEYIQSDSGLALHVNVLGFPIRCDNSK